MRKKCRKKILNFVFSGFFVLQVEKKKMNPLSTIIMMICLMEIIECRRYNYVMKNRKRTMPKITKSEDNFEFKIKVLQHDRNKTTKTTTFVVDDHKQTITTMSTIIDDNSLIKKTKSNGLKTTKSNGQKTTKSKEKPTRPREKTTKSMEKSTRPQEQPTTKPIEQTTKSMEKTTKSKTETTKSKAETTKSKAETTKSKEQTTKSSETPPPSTKLKEKSTIPNEQTTKSEGTSVKPPPPPPSKTSKPPPSRPTTLSGKFFERLESFYNLLDDYYRDEPIQYWFLLFTFEIFLFIFGYFLGSQSQNREKF